MKGKLQVQLFFWSSLIIYALKEMLDVWLIRSICVCVCDTCESPTSNARIHNGNTSLYMMIKLICSIYRPFYSHCATRSIIIMTHCIFCILYFVFFTNRRNCLFCGDYRLIFFNESITINYVVIDCDTHMYYSLAYIITQCVTVCNYY